MAGILCLLWVSLEFMKSFTWTSKSKPLSSNKHLPHNSPFLSPRIVYNFSVLAYVGRHFQCLLQWLWDHYELLQTCLIKWLLVLQLLSMHPRIIGSMTTCYKSGLLFPSNLTSKIIWHGICWCPGGGLPSGIVLNTWNEMILVISFLIASFQDSFLFSLSRAKASLIFWDSHVQSSSLLNISVCKDIKEFLWVLEISVDPFPIWLIL